LQAKRFVGPVQSSSVPREGCRDEQVDQGATVDEDVRPGGAASTTRWRRGSVLKHGRWGAWNGRMRGPPSCRRWSSSSSRWRAISAC